MEDITRPEISKMEHTSNPQKPETSTSPPLTSPRIVVPTIPKLQAPQLETSPTLQKTKAEIITSPQSLATKLETKLNPNYGEAIRLDDSDHEKDEGDAESQRTTERVGKDGNTTVPIPEELNERKEDRPFMSEDSSTKVDIQLEDEGDDNPTLPMNKENENDKFADIDHPHKKQPPMYLFPLKRMELAWTRSKNMCDFLLKAILIIFTTFGWMFCVGGVPFVSLAMLIVGSIFINDCNIQPNIPVYLIVAGTFGTIQHVTSIWTKYLPKDSQGQMKQYRSYCVCFDSVVHLFLAIWFVVGCIWVYGVYKQVDFQDTYKDEYCHKTLYLFSFWILNLSFITLAILVVIGLIWMIGLVITN